MENYNQYFEQGHLIFKYLNGQITPYEKEKLDHWISLSERNEALFARLTDKQTLQSEIDVFVSPDKQEAWKRVSLETGVKEPVHSKVLSGTFLKYVAAAIFLIISGITGYQMWMQQMMKNTVSGLPTAEITPGKDRATLTLADGSRIMLDEVAEGNIATQGNLLISKTEDGQLVYTAGDRRMLQKNGVSRHTYNVISTPKGGQFKVVLPDGSRVWLNAASSLRYPTKFGQERTVELTGEAYFEITKADNQSSGKRNGPFHVISGNQTVEVLGTTFNVNSYSDEQSITTTLVEGRVKVVTGGRSPKSGNLEGLSEQTVMLKPGEQARQSGGKSNQIRVISKVDLDQVIGWRNGQFIFRNANLVEIMRQISRWYDVDVVFEGKVPEIKYRGQIAREAPISQILQILQVSGVNFKIEGRKIVVKT